MLTTPDWWPHNVESWLELSEYFSTSKIYDKSVWEKLPYGQSNHNYKLTLPFGCFFVQSVSPSNLQLLPQMSMRVSQLELSKIPAVCPWLVDCLVDNIHLKISKWFDSFSFKELNFNNPQFINNLTCFLVQLHGVQATDFAALKIPRLNIVSHLKKYHAKAIINNPENQEVLNTLLTSSLELARDFSSSHLCHNDLGPSNLLWQGSSNELKVIDWEYACISDPVFDLAGLISSCHLTQLQEKALVADYTSQLKVEIGADKLARMKILYSNLLQLWTSAG